MFMVPENIVYLFSRDYIAYGSLTFLLAARLRCFISGGISENSGIRIVSNVSSLVHIIDSD